MKIDASKPAHPFPPKHILAPLDFSDPCLYGLAAALDLAKRFSAKLTVVHVTRHMPPGARVMMGVADEIKQDWENTARQWLADFVAEHVPDDVPVQQVIAMGKPFQKVVELATERECDLIVISTHGYTGLAHVLIGSDAERIIQHAPCPVLVVRGRPDEKTPSPANATVFRWILLPTDFSENSRKAVPVAQAMAREFKARLTLAHVQPSMWSFQEQDRAAECSKIDSQLKKFSSELIDKDLNASTSLLEGNPHRTLCDIASEEDGPGLIVIATHGITGWKHALIGSTAERMVQHAPCPVLVVR